MVDSIYIQTKYAGLVDRAYIFYSIRFTSTFYTPMKAAHSIAMQYALMLVTWPCYCNWLAFH